MKSYIKLLLSWVASLFTKKKECVLVPIKVDTPPKKSKAPRRRRTDAKK